MLLIHVKTVYIRTNAKYDILGTSSFLVSSSFSVGFLKYFFLLINVKCGFFKLYTFRSNQLFSVCNVDDIITSHNKYDVNNNNRLPIKKMISEFIKERH